MNKENLMKKIEVAVDWWAKAIANPKHDNGETMPMLAQLMIMSGQDKLRPEQILKFKQQLALKLYDELVEKESVRLDVDYHPCRILREAGDSINLSDMNFPWKTTMVITEDSIEVSCGYGAPYESIWPKEKKVEKITNNLNKTLKRKK